MRTRHPFRLNRTAALLAMVSAAFSPSLLGAVARVEFTAGDVIAVSADGSVRRLARGASIDVGDTVDTGDAGRAQLRFTDGALSSLLPGTRFRVDEYRYAGKADGSERGFFRLLRGGLRTITGAIGRANRNAYRLTTPTATIGIRGTEYLAREGSLSVTVGEGVIEVCNAAGCLSVADGETIFVRDANTAPAFTLKRTELGPPPPPQQGGGTQTQGPDPSPEPRPVESYNEEGEPEQLALKEDNGDKPDPGNGPDSEPGDGAVVEPEVPPPPPATFAFQGIQAFALDGATQLILQEGGATLLESSAEAIAFHTDAAPDFLGIGTASTGEPYFDGTIGLGRWNDGTISVLSGSGTVGVPLGPDQGLHYVFGTPASPVPSAGTATYSLLAATRPTAEDGSLPGGSFSCGSSGCLGIDFGTGKVGVDFAVNFATAGYQVQSSGGVLNPAASTVSVIAGTPAFAGVGIPTSGTGAACASGCATDLAGFFAGLDATKAGFTYSIADLAGPSVHGAAALGRSSFTPPVTPEPPPPPPPAPSTLPGFAAAVSFGVGSGETEVLGTDCVGTTCGTPDLSATFDDTKITRLALTADPDNTYDASVTATVEGESIGGVLFLGRWTNGNLHVFPVDTTAESGQGYHYVAGIPTSPMPSSGVATYNLSAATVPTYSVAGGGGLGTPSVTGGSLSADFGSGDVDARLSFSFSSGAVANLNAVSSVVSESAGFYGLGTTTVTGAESGAPCAFGCATDVTGFFAGANASHAGLAYLIDAYTLDETYFSINGAAAFARSGSISTLLTGTATYNLAFAHDDDNVLVSNNGFLGLSDAAVVLNESATLDGLGKLVSFTDGAGSTEIGESSVAEFGNDGVIGWGRWTGGALTGLGTHGSLNLGATNGNLHYVVGVPTSSNDMEFLAANSFVATYGLQGGTAPSIGSAGSYTLGSLNSGSLTANFGAGSVSGNLNLTLNTSDVYDLSWSSLPISGSGFGGAGSASGAACFSGCATNIQGFFAGSMASRAGVSYNVSADGGTFINGAAAFTRESLAPGGPSLGGGF
jgi:hypothetical protein